MDLLDILRACLRRWYVFLPILGVTGFFAVTSYSASQPQYTATTSVLVVPSRDLIVARGAQGMGGAPVTTPFNSGSGASSLAGLLSNALNTSTVRRELLPEGGALITAARDTVTDSEFVGITVNANSEDRATQAVETVNGGANRVLANLQTAAGAPEGQLYVTAPGGPVDPPSVDYPDRLRGVIGLVLAGTLAAVVMSVLVQAFAAGRTRRSIRQARSQARPMPPRQKRPHAGMPSRAPLGRGERDVAAAQPEQVDLRPHRSRSSS